MTYATKSKTSPREVVRTLRDEIATQDHGGTGGVSSTALLLTALCQLQGELGNIEHVPAPGSVQKPEGALRAVRQCAVRPEATPCPPQERPGIRQPLTELRNSLYELSHEGTLEAQAITIAVNGFPLSPRLPGRVAMLKGFGNAIVPPLAAEFVKAAEEAIRMIR